MTKRENFKYSFFLVVKILLAQEAGFCFGVRRAIEITYRALEEGRGKVYTFGELIHNHQFIEKMKADGIKVAEKIEEIPEGATVVIRSHGIAPEMERKLRERFRVVDATCPYVKKSQQIASQIVSSGTELVIFGDSNHPEIRGIQGYAEGKAVVVKDEEEAKKLPKKAVRAVIAQTTNIIESYKKVVGELLERSELLQVFQTICPSTLMKQRSARELALKVDLMLVIGGKHSSNTKKLYKTCLEVQPNTYHIESEEDLNLIDLEKYEKIGITAGASTPDFVIEKIIEIIKRKNTV